MSHEDEWPADFLPCDRCGEGADPNLPGEALLCIGCWEFEEATRALGGIS